MHFWESSVTSVPIILIQRTLNSKKNKHNPHLQLDMWQGKVTSAAWYWTGWLFCQEEPPGQSKSPPHWVICCKRCTPCFTGCGLHLWLLRRNPWPPSALPHVRIMIKIQCLLGDFLTVNILTTIVRTAGSVNNLHKANNLIIWLIHHQPICCLQYLFVSSVNWLIAVMNYLSNGYDWLDSQLNRRRHKWIFQSKPQTYLWRFLSASHVTGSYHQKSTS